MVRKIVKLFFKGVLFITFISSFAETCQVCNLFISRNVATDLYLCSNIFFWIKSKKVNFTFADYKILKTSTLFLKCADKSQNVRTFERYVSMQDVKWNRILRKMFMSWLLQKTWEIMVWWKVKDKIFKGLAMADPTLLIRSFFLYDGFVSLTSHWDL